MSVLTPPRKKERDFLVMAHNMTPAQVAIILEAAFKYRPYSARVLEYDGETPIPGSSWIAEDNGSTICKALEKAGVA